MIFDCLITDFELIKKHLFYLKEKLKPKKIVCLSITFPVDTLNKVIRQKSRHNFQNIDDLINFLKNEKKYNKNQIIVDVSFSSKDSSIMIMEFCFLNGIRIVYMEHELSVIKGINYLIPLTHNEIEVLKEIKKIYKEINAYEIDLKNLKKVLKFGDKVLEEILKNLKSREILDSYNQDSICLSQKCRKIFDYIE
ncbi:MAG: hypothetical protein QW076_02125 [Candidatus Anstonellales archaeon]